MQKLDLKNGNVYFIPEFLSEEESEVLFEFCMKLPFAEYKVNVFGKLYDQPRRTCFLGKADYHYSGAEIKATSIPKEIEAVIDRISKHFPNQPRPNAVLCNLYRNGKDYIGRHSDKESDLVKGSYIHGLSLGAERDFFLDSRKDRRIEEEKIVIPLTSGSLITMAEKTQDNYTHMVPKRLKVTEPRINLTFRVVN